MNRTLDVLNRNSSFTEPLGSKSFYHAEEKPDTFTIKYCSDFGFGEASSGVQKHFYGVTERLKSLGIKMEKININLPEDTLLHTKEMIAVDLFLPLLLKLQSNPEVISNLLDETKAWLNCGHNVSGVRYSLALLNAERVKKKLRSIIGKNELLLTPSVYMDTPSECFQSLDPYMFTLPINPPYKTKSKCRDE